MNQIVYDQIILYGHINLFVLMYSTFYSFLNHVYQMNLAACIIQIQISKFYEYEFIWKNNWVLITIQDYLAFIIGGSFYLARREEGRRQKNHTRVNAGIFFILYISIFSMDR